MPPVVDEHGNLPLDKLSEVAALNISGVDVVKRNLTAGDGHVDEIFASGMPIKVRLRDQRP